MKKSFSVFLASLLLLATVGVFVARSCCSITKIKTTTAACCPKCTGNCCSQGVKVFSFKFESVLKSQIQVIPHFPDAVFLIPQLISGAFYKDNFKGALEFFKPPGAINILTSPSFTGVFRI